MDAELPHRPLAARQQRDPRAQQHEERDAAKPRVVHAVEEPHPGQNPAAAEGAQ